MRGREPPPPWWTCEAITRVFGVSVKCVVEVVVKPKLDAIK